MQAVDIVGCDVGDGSRNCTAHEICGQHLRVDDVIVFRSEVACVDEGRCDGDLEYVVKAYVLRDGSPTCHVGFLPRRFLKARESYNNKMATVVEDLRVSDNSQKRRRSEQHGNGSLSFPYGH
ncbi:hypothetical protein DVH05_019055 [Phytophthora capsici]|nr:hypothetical protein DVH05_019055 [Phytophthora capsici]